MSYPICQHIKADGVQCESPAVKDKVLCYYHLRTYDTKSYAGEHGYWPPPLENHQAIQVTIFNALRGLCNGSLDR